MNDDLISSQLLGYSFPMSALKEFINSKEIDKLARSFAKNYPDFEQDSFVRSVTKKIPSLELKDRVKCVADALHLRLPQEASRRYSILKKVSQDLDLIQNDNFFLFWPLLQLVESYGLDDFESSIDVLRELTPSFSAEFAIRPFIKKDPEQVKRKFLLWARDPNHHVRRWVSEGTRPLLPWGMKLDFVLENPDWSLELLEILKFDPEEYVRRSVANHLNDFSKKHPEIVIKTLKRWLTEDQSQKKKIETNRLVKHALRTLIKKGNPAALKLIGFGQKIKGVSTKLELSRPRVRIGQSLELKARITNQSSQKVAIVLDYVVYLLKKNGTQVPKVFKWKSLTLQAGEQVIVNKKHLFSPITTRKYYSGKHGVALQLNGNPSPSVGFILTNC